MMRDVGSRMYTASQWGPRMVAGAVRTEVVNGIPQSWAVSRPVAAPAPQYSPPVGLWRPGSIGLTMPRPNKMMDPSDQSTWQREYRFT